MGVVSRMVEQTAERLRTMSHDDVVRAIAFLRSLRQSPSRELREWAAKKKAEMTKALRGACSMPRIEQFRTRGTPWREKGMVRARGRVRIGDSAGSVPTRRYTPPQCVQSEDRYDRMSAAEAAACRDAPSITGRQLYELRLRRRDVEPRKLKRRKSKTA
jgi:hypothetical protein